MESVQLRDLLKRWAEAYQRGEILSLRDLCPDDPSLLMELRQHIEILYQMGHVLRPVPAPSTLIAQHLGSLHEDQPTRAEPKEDSNGTMVQALDETPLPGQLNRPRWPVIPGYQILGELGQGGMGIVYKAKQLKLNRMVALKMIHGSHINRDALDRFRMEAQAIAQIRHANIIQIFEIGEHQSMPFIALEFCEGGHLGSKIQDEPMSPQMAARMVETLARAMQVVHDLKIIHRDLKPPNILLLADGTPKITDFGLAKRTDVEDSKTVAGVVIGTPSYMAPEQAHGEAKTVTPLADVYSLGAILYYLLTAQPPFRGANVMETLERVRSEEPVRPTALIGKIPADLETICLKCLEKESSRRYASALELSDDLNRFLNGEAIHARPIRRWERLWRWCRRKPTQAALIAVCFLTFVVIPPLLIWLQLRAFSSAALAEEQARNMEAQKYLDFVSKLRLYKFKDEPGWTWEGWKFFEQAAASTSPAKDPQELRNELMGLLSTIDLGNHRNLAPGFQAGLACFSPDGKTVAISQFKASGFAFLEIKWIDVTTGQEIESLKLFNLSSVSRNNNPFDQVPDAPRQITFSGDGKQLFLGMRSGTIIRWDLEQKPLKPILWKAHTDEVTGLVIAPDGQSFCTSSKDGYVKRWSLREAEKCLAKFQGPKNHAGALFLFANPQSILAYMADQTNYLDPVTLQKIASEPNLGGAKLCVYHAPSQTLIQANGDQLRISSPGWPLPELPITTDLKHPHGNGRIAGLAIHPQGSLLATTCDTQGELKLWDLSTQKRILTLHLEQVTGVAFSPDGCQLLVTENDKTSLFDLVGFGTHQLWAKQALPIQQMRVSSKDQLITCSAILNDHTWLSFFQGWKLDSFGKPTFTQANYPGTIRSICAVHGDKGLLLGQRDVQQLHLFSNQNGQLLKTFPLNTKKERKVRLEIEPHGQRFWHVEEDQVTCRRIEDGQVALPIFRHPGLTSGRRTFASLKVTSKWVLIGGEDSIVRVLNTTDGTSYTALACHDPTWSNLLKDKNNAVRAIDVNTTETVAAIGSDDGYLRLFALPEGKLLHEIPAHKDRLESLAFDPTGRWLLTGGREGQVHIWEWHNQHLHQRFTIPAEKHSVHQVLFSTDGKQMLILYNGESAIHIWKWEDLLSQFAKFQIGF